MSDNAGVMTTEEQWRKGLETADPALLRAAAKGMFAPDCEFRRPCGTDGQERFVGYDAWAPWIENIVTAFHPVQPRRLDRFGSGDNRFCQVSLIQGIHSGTFALPGMKPVPASGRPVSYEEITYSTVADSGLMTRQWAYFDLYNILRQVGAQ